MNDMGAWTGARLDDWKDSVERRLAPLDLMGDRLTRVEGKVDTVAEDISESNRTLKDLAEAFYADRRQRELDRRAENERHESERKEKEKERKADKKFFVTTVLAGFVGVSGLVVTIITLVGQ